LSKPPCIQNRAKAVVVFLRKLSDQYQHHTDTQADLCCLNSVFDVLDLSHHSVDLVLTQIWDYEKSNLAAYDDIILNKNRVERNLADTDMAEQWNIFFLSESAATQDLLQQDTPIADR
jgi:hypothetical protein